jgi:hypothetical protein
VKPPRIKAGGARRRTPNTQLVRSRRPHAERDAVTVRVGDDTRIRVAKRGSIDDLDEVDSVVVAGMTTDTVDTSSITEGGLGASADGTG